MRKRSAINAFAHSIKIILSGCIIFITACAASPATVSAPEPTGTPVPTETSPANITLYRGNPQRTGVFDFAAIRQEPSIQWQTKVSSTWLMSPILANGFLYTGSGDGVLHAVDVQTGEKIWSTGGFSQLENSGAISGDTLVAGGYDQRVRALDRHTGEVLWSFDTVYPVQASPLIVDDRVYIATDHALYTLDLSTGQLQSQAPTGNEGAYMGAPAYEDGIIYTTGGKYLLALDSTNGKELWRIEHSDMFTALAVANGLIYVGNFDGYFYAFDQKNGAEKWKFQSGGLFWAAPAVEENTVYAGNDDLVYALNAQTGEQIWKFQMAGKAVSDPMLSDGVLYVSDSAHEFPRGPRHLYALDASSGELLWTFETVATFLPAPALSEDTIYVTTTGEVLALH
ncbi:MAG TPA: PQQ-binding-like beta-propeller repeat protein [Anaerolineales bacterium]